MHSTPVTIEMVRINTKENKTIPSPIIPKIKLFLAPSSLLASPFENINLYPPIINIVRAVSPANARRALRIFRKITEIQLRVATFSALSKFWTQLPHSLNIIREYQRED